MKTVRLMFVNITVAVVLAILMSWMALFTFCQYNQNYCQQDHTYITAGGLAATVTLATFYLHQLKNTHHLMHPRRRPLPHVVSRYTTFGKVAQTMWDNNVIRSIPLDDSENFGWVVKFDQNAYPVIVQQKEFYYWLLNVVRLQYQFEMYGKKAINSPLGYRHYPELSRKHLDAYLKLLEMVDGIEYLNANVKRIKPMYANDVWAKIIKPLEIRQPMVKI